MPLRTYHVTVTYGTRYRPRTPLMDMNMRIRAHDDNDAWQRVCNVLVVLGLKPYQWNITVTSEGRELT